MKKILFLVFGTLFILLALVLPLTEWSMSRDHTPRYLSAAVIELVPPTALREHLGVNAQREWVRNQVGQLRQPHAAERMALSMAATLRGDEASVGSDLHRLTLQAQLASAIDVRGPRGADERVRIEASWSAPGPALAIAERALALVSEQMSVQYGPASGWELRVLEPPRAAVVAREQSPVALWLLTGFGFALGTGGLLLFIRGLRMDAKSGDAMA